MLWSLALLGEAGLALVAFSLFVALVCRPPRSTWEGCSSGSSSIMDKFKVSDSCAPGSQGAGLDSSRGGGGPGKAPACVQGDLETAHWTWTVLEVTGCDLALFEVFIVP